jgi:O-antigen/teichoic acid export membrane protein
MSLYRISVPVFTAIYPRLTQLVSLDEQHRLRELYHKSSQLMSVLILPIAAVIAMFSYEILLIWTQNPVTAKNTHLLVSILTCGTALNILGHVPYALQLAKGMTKLSIICNLIAILILVPLIIFMTNRYGGIGGATVWVILNCGYFLIATPLVHRILLPRENWRWFCQDVGMPLLACLTITGIARLLVDCPFSYGIAIGYLLLVSISTLTVTSLATAVTRTWLIGEIHYKDLFGAIIRGGSPK